MITSYEFILSLLLIFTFLYWPWQWFILDLFRQRLFVIRDKVFINAAEENKFESKDYRVFRKRINDMIRYAHCIAWWRMLLVSIFLKDKYRASKIEKFGDKYIEKEYEKAMIIAMLLIIARSPIMMIFTMVVTPLCILVFLFGFKPLQAALRIIRRSETAVYRDIEFSNKAHC